VTDVAAKDSLTVTDNRTGQQYDIAITDNTIAAKDLGQIRLDDEQPGLEVLADQLVGVCAEEPGLDGEVGVLGRQPACRGIEYVVSVCQSGPEPDAVFGEGDR